MAFASVSPVWAEAAGFGCASFSSGNISESPFFANGPMLDITSEDYTPEPDPQSYGSHGTLRAKFLWVMNLRGSCGSVISVTVHFAVEQLAFSTPQHSTSAKAIDPSEGLQRFDSVAEGSLADVVCLPGYR